MPEWQGKYKSKINTLLLSRVDSNLVDSKYLVYETKNIEFTKK